MARKGERASHCRHGHAYTPENVQWIRKPDGSTHQRCKACQHTRRMANSGWMRDYLLDRRYGITRAQRSEILVSQDGLCAICYERPAVTVDHDHDTGRIRGMLCKACNVALGVLGDDEQSIRRVLEYLTQPPLEEAV